MFAMIAMICRMLGAPLWVAGGIVAYGFFVDNFVAWAIFALALLAWESMQ